MGGINITTGEFRYAQSGIQGGPEGRENSHERAAAKPFSVSVPRPAPYPPSAPQKTPRWTACVFLRPPYSTAGSAPAAPDPQTGRVRQTRSHTPSSKYTAVQDGAKAEAIFEKFKAMKKAAAPAAPAMKKDLLSQALEGRYIPSGANTKAPSCPDASSFGTYSCRNHAAADASGRGTAGATESETAVTPRLRLDLAELGKPPNELRPLRDALSGGYPPSLARPRRGQSM